MIFSDFVGIIRLLIESVCDYSKRPLWWHEDCKSFGYGGGSCGCDGIPAFFYIDMIYTCIVGKDEISPIIICIVGQLTNLFSVTAIIDDGS